NEYDVCSVVLKRENTLKYNMKINSKEQAEIVLENGEWYIIDKSEKQTTFVRPGSLTKLNKGDIILLGDTKFIFE
ncbi:MAG: FHA domain-containing protein, partial [Bacteroidota bacterium]